MTAIVRLFCHITREVGWGAASRQIAQWSPRGASSMAMTELLATIGPRWQTGEFQCLGDRIYMIIASLLTPVLHEVDNTDTTQAFDCTAAAIATILLSRRDRSQPGWAEPVCWRLLLRWFERVSTDLRTASLICDAAKTPVDDQRIMLRSRVYACLCATLATRANVIECSKVLLQMEREWRVDLFSNEIEQLLLKSYGGIFECKMELSRWTKK